MLRQKSAGWRQDRGECFSAAVAHVPPLRRCQHQLARDTASAAAGTCLSWMSCLEWIPAEHVLSHMVRNSLDTISYLYYAGVGRAPRHWVAKHKLVITSSGRSPPLSWATNCFKAAARTQKSDKLAVRLMRSSSRICVTSEAADTIIRLDSAAGYKEAQGLDRKLAASTKFSRMEGGEKSLCALLIASPKFSACRHGMWLQTM